MEIDLTPPENKTKMVMLRLPESTYKKVTAIARQNKKGAGQLGRSHVCRALIEAALKELI